MTNVVNGTRYITDKTKWRQFDALPKRVRMALAACHDDFLAYPLYNNMVKRGQTEAGMLAIVEEWQRQETADHWARMERMAEHGTPYTEPMRANVVKNKQKALAIDVSKLIIC